MHPVENIARHPDRLRAAGLINLWAATGVEYTVLLDRLIKLALERHAAKQGLKTSAI